MDPQKIARATGVLFLITFVTSIPALLLYNPILKDNGYSTYITGAVLPVTVSTAADVAAVLNEANGGQ